MKVENIGVALAGVVNLGCICGLAYIGLKRNRDCYNAEMNALNLELDNIGKDIEIYKLKREIEEMKLNNSVSKEEEA